MPRDKHGWVIRHNHLVACRKVCKVCRCYGLWKSKKEPFWVCQVSFVDNQVMILAEGDPLPKGCVYIVEHCVAEKPGEA
jgi:hypothetical protein